MLKRRLILTLAFLVGVSVVMSWSVASAQLPATVQSCIPTQTHLPITRSEIIGSTRLSGRTYYLLAAYAEGQTSPTDLVISTEGESCQEEFFNPMSDRLSLTQFLPQSVARQLTLARLRRAMAQAGSAAAFQQQVDQAAENGNPVWFEEEAWALQQLGINIPANVQIQQ